MKNAQHVLPSSHWEWKPQSDDCSCAKCKGRIPWYTAQEQKKGTWPSLGIWQKVPWRKCSLNRRAGTQEMEAEGRKHEQKSRKKVVCAGSLVWVHREGKSGKWWEREQAGGRSKGSLENTVAHQENTSAHITWNFPYKWYKKITDKLKQAFWPHRPLIYR